VNSRLGHIETARRGSVVGAKRGELKKDPLGVSCFPRRAWGTGVTRLLRCYSWISTVKPPNQDEKAQYQGPVSSIPHACSSSIARDSVFSCWWLRVRRSFGSQRVREFALGRGGSRVVVTPGDPSYSLNQQGSVGRGTVGVVNLVLLCPSGRGASG
jgi:hypothetical protein